MLQPNQSALGQEITQLFMAKYGNLNVKADRYLSIFELTGINFSDLQVHVLRPRIPRNSETRLEEDHGRVPRGVPEEALHLDSGHADGLVRQGSQEGRFTT